MATIRFLTNEAGKTEGLAYAGFETFRGSPYASCARETGQNSRDAWAGTGPVTVKYRLHNLDRDLVPFAAELQRSIECCLMAPQDQKTEQHLRRALETICGQQVKVLEISDFNTTGLTGPIDDELSVFNALVKGDGVTNKPDATSAGSFGIGKNAAYAVSDLQTVIYSTVYSDSTSETLKFAAQGRLRLISHRDGEKRLSAEGYWGGAEFSAIEEQSKVPAWMQRTEVGTSIFAIGFREEADWLWRMVLSIVSNFFLAIDRGEICFELQDSVRIDKTSLDAILDSEKLMEVAMECDRVMEVERAKRLVKCVRSDATTHHKIQIAGLGSFDLHLLVEEGLQRDVHVLRNGIYICDNFSKFGEPLKRFPATREFTALLEPSRAEEGRSPSSLLKRIENPAHDAFEPERIVVRGERERARRQIKQLVKRVRDVIRNHAKIDDVQRSHLDELSRFFFNTGDGARGDDRDSEPDPNRYRYGRAESTRGRASGTNGPGEGLKRGSNTGRPPGQRSGESKRSGTRGGIEQAVPLRGVRTVIPDASRRDRRKIFFTCDVAADLELAVFAAGLADDVELKIERASAPLLENGRLGVVTHAGVRSAVEIELFDEFTGPIELRATKSQEVEEVA